jgi:hypothetical protein
MSSLRCCRNFRWKRCRLRLFDSCREPCCCSRPSIDLKLRRSNLNRFLVHLRSWPNPAVQRQRQQREQFSSWRFPLFCAGVSCRRSPMPTFNPCSSAANKIDLSKSCSSVPFSVGDGELLTGGMTPLLTDKKRMQDRAKFSGACLGKSRRRVRRKLRGARGRSHPLAKFRNCECRAYSMGG